MTIRHAAADVTSEAERLRIDELVLAGLEVSSLDLRQLAEDAR